MAIATAKPQTQLNSLVHWPNPHTKCLAKTGYAHFLTQILFIGVYSSKLKRPISTKNYETKKQGKKKLSRDKVIKKPGSNVTQILELSEREVLIAMINIKDFSGKGWQDEQMKNFTRDL